MAEMTLAEAQLFRMLTTLFGQERVIWSMSVRAVCGGEIPQNDTVLRLRDDGCDLSSWAGKDKCLFTVVDCDDNAKMVLEFAPDFTEFIEVEQLERQKRLPALLNSIGVQYVTISGGEMSEITDPQSSLDLVSFLNSKFGIEDSAESLEEGDEATE